MFIKYTTNPKDPKHGVVVSILEKYESHPVPELERFRVGGYNGLGEWMEWIAFRFHLPGFED